MNTPKRGDLVFLQYGCMHGSDFGTVLGEETTSFGTHYVVRKSDFSLTTVAAITGVVSGKVVVDYDGKEWLSARGADRVGAYLVSQIDV